MAWFWDVLKTISGNTAANQKLIIDGFKELAEARRLEAEERRKEAESRRKEAEHHRLKLAELTEKMRILGENEDRCHKMLIQANTMLRDMREHEIFATRMKPDNHTK